MNPARAVLLSTVLIAVASSAALVSLVILDRLVRVPIPYALVISGVGLCVALAFSTWVIYARLFHRRHQSNMKVAAAPLIRNQTTSGSQARVLAVVFETPRMKETF